MSVHICVGRVLCEHVNIVLGVCCVLERVSVYFSISVCMCVSVLCVYVCVTVTACVLYVGYVCVSTCVSGLYVVL